MIIHLLCNDGSPLGVTSKDLWGEGNRGIGLGGSEYALLTMCEEWHKAGHEVVLYNNPMTPNGSEFEQRQIRTFDPNENRDILITFRSPNPRSISAKGLKVFWSCDQYTVGSFSNFAGYMDKIVCISPFHAKHFLDTYRIKDAIVIDLPVRMQDLLDAPEQERVPNRLIFTSVPDRGLKYLWKYWPQIQKRCPETSLVITSDYRLWGVDERNRDYKISWMYSENVVYLGAVKRVRLIEEQLKADLLVYPSLYDELFCVAVSEAECAGAYPITSDSGALGTTNMGTIVPGNARTGGSEFNQAFIDAVVDMLKDREKLEENRATTMKKARERFNPKNILEQWDTKVFGEIV